MLHLKTVKIGFDLGGTLFHSDSQGKKVFFPRALEVVTNCVKQCEGAYIISRVNDPQRIRALAALKDNNFHEITGMPKENVFFCGQRNQKGIIATKLGINCFIDDRPEVMAYMDKDVYRILFDPIPTDVKNFNLGHLPIVRSWIEIQNLLFSNIT